MNEQTTANSDSSPAWGTTSFEPGGDVGLVARHTIGLVERDNPSTRERLWGLVSSDAPLDDILDELSSTGIKSLPDFGIAQVDGDSIRVVARGRTVVSAELASGETHTIDAASVRTWIEEVVADAVSVTISLAPAGGDDAPGDGPGFAVLAGSVPAASLTRRYDEPDQHAGQADGWSAAAPPAAPRSPKPAADDQPVAAPVERTVEELAEEVAAAPEVDLEFSTGDASADEMESVDPALASGASWFDPAEAAADDAANQVVEDVAPEDVAPEDVAPEDVADEFFAGIDAPAPSAPAPNYGGPIPSPDSTVILDGAGDASHAKAPFDAEADLASSLMDDDAGPPVVGVLLFSNGVRIEVDRSVLVGRNPKVAGAVDGPLPHIMKYEGPGQGLSRTHAEVRIEGGSLVLEDLQSTNGTEIEMPGEVRRRLHGGEPVTLVPGAWIDFGDELTCTVEVTS